MNSMPGPSVSQKIGVVAIQGDFDKHLEMLEAMGQEGREVRLPEDLTGLDRLIIPGGESTTVGLLMERLGLGAAIIKAGGEGMPVWGTCMGMIMMAKSIVGRTNQYTLGLLDIEVERNAFGAQVHSFEDHVELLGEPEPVMGVFIRAPVVTQTGDGVEVLAKYEGKIVGVKQGRMIGTSFHPELTSDTRMHAYFLRI